MKKILFVLVLIFSFKVFAGNPDGAVCLDVMPELPAQEVVENKDVVREEFFKALAELLKHEIGVKQLEKSRPGKVRRWFGGSQQEFNFEKAEYELGKARAEFYEVVKKHKIDKQVALDYLKDYLNRADLAELDLEVKQAFETYVEGMIGQIEFGHCIAESAFSFMEKNQSEEDKEARELIAKKAEEDFNNYVNSVLSKINKLSDLWILRKKFYFCKSDVEAWKKIIIFEDYIENDGSTISPEGKSFLKGVIVLIMQLHFVLTIALMNRQTETLCSLDPVSIVLREFQESRLKSCLSSSSDVVVYLFQFGFYKTVDCWYSIFTV